MPEEGDEIKIDGSVFEHRKTENMPKRKYVIYCREDGCNNIIATSDETPPPFFKIPCSKCMIPDDFVDELKDRKKMVEYKSPRSWQPIYIYADGTIDKTPKDPSLWVDGPAILWQPPSNEEESE